MRVGAVAATTSTPYRALVLLLVPRPVTGLPVVGRDGKLAGVVHEAELLAKEELQQDPGLHPRMRRHRRALRVKAAGGSAGDVMTRHRVTIRPEAPLRRQRG